MKPLRLCLLFALTLTLSACACHRIHDGVVVSKRAHKGMAIDPLQTGPFMRFSQPDIYWVKVAGKNEQGHLVQKNIAVFRNDFTRIQVGDHWSAKDGLKKAAVAAERIRTSSRAVPRHGHGERFRETKTRLAAHF